MSDPTETQAVEAMALGTFLAGLVDGAVDELAAEILTSDWLAANNAAQRRAGAEEAANALHAHADEIASQRNAAMNDLARLREAVEGLAAEWERNAGDDRDAESRTLRAVAAYIRSVLAQSGERA